MTQALAIDQTLAEIAQNATAWPFEEARKLVERLKRTGKKEALFETGYGPPGCPISAPSAKSPARAWCAMPFGS